MTTIVGDWRRKILVADSQHSDDASGIKYFEDKVFAIPGGWLGGAGHKGDIEKVLDYLKSKGKTIPKLKNSNEFLKLTHEGLFSAGNDLEWESVNAFMAIGSGAMAAEVLLRHEYAAEDAVLGACSVDLMSHEPIKVYEVSAQSGVIWKKA